MGAFCLNGNNCFFTGAPTGPQERRSAGNYVKSARRPAFCDVHVSIGRIFFQVPRVDCMILAVDWNKSQGRRQGRQQDHVNDLAESDVTSIN